MWKKCKVRGKAGHGVIWGCEEKGLERNVVPEGLLLSDLPADTIALEDGRRGSCFMLWPWQQSPKVVEQRKAEDSVGR